MDKEIMQAIYDVRERVVRIETKLDQYNAVRETAYKAKELAEDNEKAIGELKDSQKWGTRTGIGALVGLLGKIFYDAIFGR